MEQYIDDLEKEKRDLEDIIANLPSARDQDAFLSAMQQLSQDGFRNSAAVAHAARKNDRLGDPNVHDHIEQPPLSTLQTGSDRLCRAKVTISNAVQDSREKHA